MKMLARREGGRRKGSPYTLDQSVSRRAVDRGRERGCQWLANAVPIGYMAVEKRPRRSRISVSYLVVACQTGTCSGGRRERREIMMMMPTFSLRDEK